MKVGDLIPIGAVGSAKSKDVLSGKTYSSDDGVDLKGSMRNNGELYEILVNEGDTFIIPEGYTKGGNIKVEIVNLRPENIRTGTTVGGIVGTAGSTIIIPGRREDGDKYISYPEITTSRKDYYLSKAWIVPDDIPKKASFRARIGAKNRGSWGYIATTAIFVNDVSQGSVSSSPDTSDWQYSTRIIDVKKGDKIQFGVQDAGFHDGRSSGSMELYYKFDSDIPLEEIELPSNI